MLLLWFAIILFSILLIFKIVYKFQHGKVKSMCSLDGKVAIVTGANTGIGLETSRDLARRGARVILACRNIENAQYAAAGIRNATGNDKVEVKLLDTSSLASVRSFANDILSSEKELHILINNAGIRGAVLSYTEDGLELIMATNHYGHFLLTNMLAPLLKASAPSRIVCVTSLLHKYADKLDPDDLNFRRMKFSRWNAYNQSKLCNVLMAAEAGRRLCGTGVTTYSAHPGIVNTEIFQKGFPWWAGLLMSWLVGFTGKDTVAGAQTSIYCAVDEDAGNETGLYYSDCEVETCAPLGRHVALASKLWTASEIDVKLAKHEANI